MATFVHTGGIDTSDATATANKILNGYTAYANGEKVTGTALSVASTATASQILSGYTAYSNLGQLIAGTLTKFSEMGVLWTASNGYNTYHFKAVINLDNNTYTVQPGYTKSPLTYTFPRSGYLYQLQTNTSTGQGASVTIHPAEANSSYSSGWEIIYICLS